MEGPVLQPQPYSGYSNGSQGYNYQPNLGYNYPPELLHLIHQHFLSFAAPHTAYYILFHVIYTCLLLSSIFGNGLVIYIFSSAKNLRTPSNLLIINLAVFDLVMFCNIPHYLLNAIQGYIVGGDLGCDIYAMLGGISGIGVSITNAFIAYDRYRTISNPIDGRLSYTKIILLILFSWLYTVPFSVLPFLQIFGRYMPEGFLTTCSFDYLTANDETFYFVILICIWSYCLPMAVIVVYYWKLFGHVRAHERMLAEQAKKMNVKSLSNNANSSAMSVEIRIAKVAFTIYFLFCLAWTPYTVNAVISIAGHRHLITPLMSMIPATAAKSVSCVDPWVYAASHPKYRLELERRLPWLGIREKNESASSAATGDSATVMTVNETVVSVDR